MAKSNFKEKDETTNNVTGLFIKQIKMQENKALIKLSDEDEFKKQNGDFAVKDEVNDVCEHILDNTAVFKKDEAGFVAFDKFLNACGIKKA